MNVLFIHDAFPAQFGRLGQELATGYGWKCPFLVQSLSSCPTPTNEMLQAVELHQMPMTAEHRTGDGIPWPQIYGQFLDQCRSVFDILRAKPQIRPDLVVAHGGRVLPRCSSATCWTARSSIIASIISRPAIATSRIASTCRPRSRPPSSRAASTRRRSPCWSTATPAIRRRSGRSRRSRSGSNRRSRSISTGSRPSSTGRVRRLDRSAIGSSRPVRRS